MEEASSRSFLGLTELFPGLEVLSDLGKFSAPPPLIKAASSDVDSVL